MNINFSVVVHVNINFVTTCQCAVTVSDVHIPIVSNLFVIYAIKCVQYVVQDTNTDVSTQTLISTVVSYLTQ